MSEKYPQPQDKSEKTEGKFKKSAKKFMAEALILGSMAGIGGANKEAKAQSPKGREVAAEKAELVRNPLDTKTLLRLSEKYVLDERVKMMSDDGEKKVDEDYKELQNNFGTEAARFGIDLAKMQALIEGMPDIKNRPDGQKMISLNEFKIAVLNSQELRELVLMPTGADMGSNAGSFEDFRDSGRVNTTLKIGGKDVNATVVFVHCKGPERLSDNRAAFEVNAERAGEVSKRKFMQENGISEFGARSSPLHFEYFVQDNRSPGAYYLIEAFGE